MVKNLPANAEAPGDASSIPGMGRSPGVGNGNPLQYSYLENSMDRGAWQATAHGVVKSRARLSTYAHTHSHKHIPLKSLPFLLHKYSLGVLLAKRWCECAWSTGLMALAKLRGTWGSGVLPAK